MWDLIGATPRGQPWTPAVTLPQGRNGLSARRMAVWWTFRAPSLGRHVHRELMRSAVLDLTPIISATTCHQRNYVPRYSRYSCKRTFNDLTDTLLHQSKRPLAYWILATFLLCLACSSRRIAREVGVHVRTSYRWCWWLRNAALSYEMSRQLEGTVEADDLYHTAGNKGQATRRWQEVVGAPSAWAPEEARARSGPL